MTTTSRFREDPFNPPCCLSPIVHAVGHVFTDIGHLLGVPHNVGPTPTATPAPPPPVTTAAPPTATPATSPTGSSSTYKGAGSPSFVAAAATPASQNVSGNKTLLGQ